MPAMIRLLRVLFQLILTVFIEVYRAKKRKVNEQTRTAIKANPRRAVHSHFGRVQPDDGIKPDDGADSVQHNAASDRTD